MIAPMRTTLTAWALVVYLALGVATSEAQLGTFSGLGSQPGLDPDGGSLGVSTDGSTVVGWARTPTGTLAFRWRESEGLHSLVDLPGGTVTSRALAVSRYGEVIAGQSASPFGDEAVLWTGNGDLVPLETVGFARDVSADGSVVVAWGPSKTAFRWTEAFGLLSLGVAGGGDAWVLRSLAISDDGTVVVGHGPVSSDNTEAWRWTEVGGAVGLGDLPGGLFQSWANDVSGDGSVVVGLGHTDGGIEAFRWTAGGMVGLGDLPGGNHYSEALAVSADGTVVVGRSEAATANAPGANRAFIWRESSGMRDLAEVLTQDYFISLGGWTLSAAQAISADGRTIVGAGTNPAGEAEAWVAVLPPACGDGLDNDGDTLADGLDPHCSVTEDPSEGINCSDGQDNDGDGLTDFPADPGCDDANDPDETSPVIACDDASDDDLDGRTDFPWDPGCDAPDDASERSPSLVCDDGADNDTDQLTDFPADTGCTGPTDLSETPDCADGFDNDQDGLFDFPADPGCDTAADPTESSPALPCDDGSDNDWDGLPDFPADLECLANDDVSEHPECRDGFDNDSDGDADFGFDLDCWGLLDLTEIPDCTDGLDNDGDGLFDFPEDPGCASAATLVENPECSDAQDSDGDGLTDFPADPGCDSLSDESERAAGLACDDGLDNDGDEFVDFPDDPGCTDPLDPSETLDGDSDGLLDFDDNCTLVSNPAQLDTDQDGYGNACDADYDNDGVVGITDFVAHANAFGAETGDPRYDEALDSDVDGAIGISEFLLVSNSLGLPPGTSGLECAGTAPCPDRDSDGIFDQHDNCLDLGNPSQVDTNLDGYGNRCDADYDDNGIVALSDLVTFYNAFGTSSGEPGYDPDLDSDSNGSVGISEFLLVTGELGQPPGPSGMACAGTPPCPAP